MVASSNTMDMKDKTKKNAADFYDGAIAVVTLDKNNNIVKSTGEAINMMGGKKIEEMAKNEKFRNYRQKSADELGSFGIQMWNNTKVISHIFKKPDGTSDVVYTKAKNVEHGTEKEKFNDTHHDKDPDIAK
ncbi:hypothetical protein TBLA_0F04160 [Henningerozyma blattae CBS 6284]|uniref:Uncharacterized protein n=1 Tax=Henningerozyma blattae (strain ATCC 34711 / CBS 6284 / DSM 70876 / NBRC 10599 / NRRL Y-10934 / UCD 77-7) TaxID=1071380 RepID=I2H6E7_HENB6|nr:hypothetical protein TBLA_0F04160 [Tetrapisispora blattae CBS 6284]CCH61949.1 hypothetical protein TBLA_0F04160 [Tetrapisispora blattae CBS 6284]